MGDHTETFQVDFDPTIISYTDLLRLFWQSHNPQRKAWSRQYRAVVLYHNQDQCEQVQHSKEDLMGKINAPVHTAISPLNQFYLAEGYHQKYYLQNSLLMADVAVIYPDENAWVDSTAVARMNGYLAGYGNAATFAHDVKRLGLSEEGERFLQKSVTKRGVSLRCFSN